MSEADEEHVPATDSTGEASVRMRFGRFLSNAHFGPFDALE